MPEESENGSPNRLEKDDLRRREEDKTNPREKGRRLGENAAMIDAPNAVS